MSKKDKNEIIEEVETKEENATVIVETEAADTEVKADVEVEAEQEEEAKKTEYSVDEDEEPEVKTTSNAFTRAMKRVFTKRPVEPVAVSVGDWLIVRAIRCLPFIQIIPILIWCFGKYPPSQKNWARAELIWIIGKILLIVIFILILKAIFRF